MINTNVWYSAIYHSALGLFVGLARTAYIYAYIHRIFGDFQAKITVCTPYICMVLTNPSYLLRLPSFKRLPKTPSHYPDSVVLIPPMFIIPHSATAPWGSCCVCLLQKTVPVSNAWGGELRVQGHAPSLARWVTRTANSFFYIRYSFFLYHNVRQCPEIGTPSGENQAA